MKENWPRSGKSRHNDWGSAGSTGARLAFLLKEAACNTERVMLHVDVAKSGRP